MKNNKVSAKKNALMNMLKQACTIVFPFLAFSYASHVLGAEIIGGYTFGQSVVSYFVYFAMLGISDYAVREIAAARGDEERIGKLANELYTIQLLSSLLSYAALFLLLWVWGELYPYRYVILIQSIQIALAAIGADWVNTAYEDFLYLTVRYLVIASVCTAAMFLTVKGPEDFYWYTFLSVMCTAGGNLWNVFYIRRYVRLRLTIRLNLKKHLPPMLTLFFNSIALVIYLNSDITILGIFLDAATVGVYSAVTKIYMMAKSIVNAFIMAAVPRLSHLAAENSKESFTQMLSKMADILCLLLFPAAVGIFFEAENMIGFVAGNAYVIGADALRIYGITIWFAVGACFFSYAVLVPVHMEKYFLLSTVLAAVLNVAINFWLIPFWGMNGAAGATLLAEFTVAAVTSHCTKKAAGVKLYIHKKDLCIDMAGGIVIGAVCLAVKQFGLPHTLELGVSIVLAAAAYGGVLLAMKNETFLMLIKSVRSS